MEALVPRSLSQMQTQVFGGGSAPLTDQKRRQRPLFSLLFQLNFDHANEMVRNKKKSGRKISCQAVGRQGGSFSRYTEGQLGRVGGTRIKCLRPKGGALFPVGGQHSHRASPAGFLPLQDSAGGLEVKRKPLGGTKALEYNELRQRDLWAGPTSAPELASEHRKHLCFLLIRGRLEECPPTSCPTPVQP